MLVTITHYENAKSKREEFSGLLRSLICTPLQIESALVLEPSSVVRYAADLLAVVVGYGVRYRGSCGVDPVALDAVIELPLFLGFGSASHFREGEP
jgi:hypothetical protein